MKQQQQQLQQPRKQQKMTSFSLSSILLISHLLCSYTIISATITTIPTSNDYLVRGLDNIEPAYKSFNGTMYAGLIPTIQYHDIFALNNNNDHKNTTENDIGKLMFWYFDTKEPLYDDTIVIWLNGGPGCSSLGGCLFENCPVTIPMHPAGFFGIDSDPNILQPNQYTWTSVTRMIYVEQPQGTGFSIGKYPKNELDLSIDFYNFLQNLYIIFNDLNLRTKKLYFFGESYAGMYVPSIAHYIYKQNKLITNAKDNNINIDNTYNFNQYIINLKGIGLGNGWMDAKIQGPAVIDYAYWHGMIDSLTSKALHNEWINCQNGNDAIKYGNTNTNINTKYKFHEFTIPDECGIMGAVLEAAGSNQVSWGLPNAYDVSTWDP